MNVIDFEYAGEKLSDYGFILCSFDSAGLETVSSGADITFNQVKGSASNYFNVTSATYEESYTSQPFQICKNPCKNVDMSITPMEISALQKWLCRKGYNTFKVCREGYEHIHWNGTFTSKQIKLADDIIGLELTLHTDAPLAYMDEVVIEKDCTDVLSFDIYDASDEEGYIYPDIEITLLESGNFTLNNSFSNETTHISNCAVNEIIKLQGREQIITSNSHISLASDFDYIFPKIYNTYENNKNTLTCNKKCKIVISYFPVIKVGL